MKDQLEEAKRVLFDASTMADRLAVFDARPWLLDEPAGAVLDALIAEGGEDLEHLAAFRGRLLALRAHGDDAPYLPEEAAYTLKSEPQDVSDAVEALMLGPRDPTRLLDEHPALLGEEAAALAADVAEQARFFGDHDMADELDGRMEALREIARSGAVLPRAEVVDLYNDLALARGEHRAMDRWFAEHPEALSTHFLTFVWYQFVVIRDDDDAERILMGEPGRYLHRVEQLCRRVGEEEALARLGRAPDLEDDFAALAAALDELAERSESAGGGKGAEPAKRLERTESGATGLRSVVADADPDLAEELSARLLDHPCLPGLAGDTHARVLGQAGVTLSHVYDTRPSRRLAELRVALAETATTPPVFDDEVQAVLLDQLGDALTALGTHTGSPDDFRAALTAYGQAGYLTDADAPEAVGRLESFGSAYWNLYQHVREPELLDGAVAAFEEAGLRGANVADRLALVRAGAAGEPPAPQAGAVTALFAVRGGAAAASSTIQSGAAAESLATDAEARCVRFAETLDPGDLAAALDAIGNLADAGSGRLDWTELAEGLAGLVRRGLLLTDGRDIVDLALFRLRDAPGATRAALLSMLLAARHTRTGDAGDIVAATDLLEDRIAAAPPGSQDHRNLLSLAGGLWRERYAATGDPAAFAKAKERLDSVLADAEPDDALFPVATTNLGALWRARYNATGDLTFLDEAIGTYERALKGWSDGSVLWARAVGNLANAVRASYEPTGDLTRLDRAIALQERSLQAFPVDHPARPQRLINLANALLTRQAATVQSPAVQSPAVQSPAVQAPAVQAPAVQVVTGQAAMVEAATVEAATGRSADGRAADLARARALYTEVLGRLPEGAPWRADVLSALGMAAGRAFDLTGDPGELETAVRLCREAVSTAPPGTPQARVALWRLAEALERRRVSATGAQDDSEGVEIFRELCAGADGDELRLVAAVTWSSYAARREAWEEAAEAARAGLGAMDALAHLQVRRDLRAGITARYPGFLATGVCALARTGDVEGAVLAVERARAVTLSETLDLGARETLTLSDEGHPELAGRFGAAVRRWRAVSGRDLGRVLAGGFAEPAPPADNEAVRAARAGLDALIGEIRALPGREGFLRPPAFADLPRSRDPLVYLVASPHGGVALVVRDGRTHALDLPGLTPDQALTWLDGLASGVPDLATASLWETVVGPLLEVIGDGPVTLIPAGLLDLLPFTAAWTPDIGRPTGRRHADDHLTITTAPNARVHAAARARAEAHGSLARLLAVHDPRPTALAPLPAASAEAEAAMTHFSGGLVVSGEGATRDLVLSHLAEADAVHFACHGRADVLDPLGSALFLAHDEPVTLADLLRVHVPVRLAVLSACETGLPGLRALDEIISLPAGLLEAGSAGVIASRWPVPDLSTALLMIRFYDAWRRDGVPPAEALRIAQRWLRDTTNAEKTAYLAPDGPSGLPRDVARPLWRSLVHLTPDARSFTSPLQWAAFTYVGA
ncbi:CHAT domain-containing protein [Sphaerisporangium dianthi]|uniref:CHAT domain-containing protein n=1 Tax=Sphaerisporangium dianthi TaxID=1436120 RepID=A0ABV9CIL4_9ACTN